MHFGNDRISIQISLKFVPRSPIDNKVALVQVMVWHQTGFKPLSEPMMVWFTDVALGEMSQSSWLTSSWSYSSPEMIYHYGLMKYVLYFHVQNPSNIISWILEWYLVESFEKFDQISGISRWNFELMCGEYGNLLNKSIFKDCISHCRNKMKRTVGIIFVLLLPNCSICCASAVYVYVYI